MKTSRSLSRAVARSTIVLSGILTRARAGRAAAVLSLFACALLAVDTPSAYATKKTGFLQANKNMSGFEANDYWVTLKNTNAAQLADTAGQPMPFLGTTPMAPDLLVKWHAGDGMPAQRIPNMGTGAFGAVFNKNGIAVRMTVWKDVNLTDLGAAPMPGFIVFGDPIYRISNDLEDDGAMDFGINITNMLVNVPEIPFSSLDPGTPTGTVPTGDGDILGFGEFLDFQVANIDPDNYLYVYGQIFDPDTREVVSTFIHVAQIPEPSSFILLAVGGASLLAFRPRRRAIPAAPGRAPSGCGE